MGTQVISHMGFLASATTFAFLLGLCQFSEPSCVLKKYRHRIFLPLEYNFKFSSRLKHCLLLRFIAAVNSKSLQLSPQPNRRNLCGYKWSVSLNCKSFLLKPAILKLHHFLKRVFCGWKMMNSSLKLVSLSAEIPEKMEIFPLWIYSWQ